MHGMDMHGMDTLPHSSPAMHCLLHLMHNMLAAHMISKLGLSSHSGATWSSCFHRASGAMGHPARHGGSLYHCSIDALCELAVAPFTSMTCCLQTHTA